MQPQTAYVKKKRHERRPACLYCINLVPMSRLVIQRAAFS